MSYRYCPICKMQHDPDTNCFDLAQQALKDAGIPVKQQIWGRKKGEGRKFKILVHKANITFGIIALIIVICAIIMVLKAGG